MNTSLLLPLRLAWLLSLAGNSALTRHHPKLEISRKGARFIRFWNFLSNVEGWLGHHHRGVLMAVGHGVWKCSEPLFDQIKWLGIAIHDPLGSSEQRIGVSGAQQRPLHAVPHGLPSETSRRGTRGGTRGGTSADIKKIDLDFKIRAFLLTLPTFWSD